MVRIAGLDSGKSRDSSALVGIDVDHRERMIKILNAKRWLGRDYIDVEKEIAHIHQSKPFDFYMVETNNVGVHVWEVLKHKYQMPAYPVTTSKDIKDPKKQQGYKVMDKNAMVKLMLQWKAEERLLFPSSTNAELEELKRQLSIFSEHRTDSGSVSYYAEGQEHDDLVMALMLACFKARAYMTETKRVIVTTNKRHDIYGGGMADIGSGVPEHLRGIQQIGYEVRMP